MPRRHRIPILISVSGCRTYTNETTEQLIMRLAVMRNRWEQGLERKNAAKILAITLALHLHYL